jgi:DNA primase
VAGRIRDEDVALVKERADIADVVGDVVTLRPAGGGNLKGLCAFHDETSPSFSVRPSVGSFHCLAGETRVLTWDGPRPISELAGSEHRVLNRRGDWVTAPFRSYGVMPLMRITLTRNRQKKEIYATDEHRWFVRSGAARQGTREVLSKDLKAGDRLAYVYPRSRIARTTLSAFGVAHGFTYGDGTRLGQGSVAMFAPGKDDALLKWFPLSPTAQYTDPDRTLAFGLPAYFKDLPSLDESAAYLLGWLAGYFAADGCVAEDGTVILNSADRGDLEFVRNMCTRLGISTYGITTQIREGFPGREPSAVHRLHLVNDSLPEDFFLLEQHKLRFASQHKAFARRGWVVQSVEPSDRVEEVFCAEVEHGHAFVLEDNILTGNCFGCGEGGDVISFVMKIDHLSFAETIERLAGRTGVTLRYEEGGVTPGRQQGQRARLIEAHTAAAEFFVEQLAGPGAKVGRQFLAERGFDQAAAEKFGVGFAPQGWDALTTHLRGRRFTDQELLAGGLVSQRQGGGVYDRFRGRLIWPIRNMSDEVIGFGARRLFDDDQGPKYLNTPETPIYKKSTVLYGVDLAKREIARRMQAVVVEGYTDVMACHLAGVETAIATCGTAFGDEHIKVLRRLLMDQNEFRGEVVFTFDGDSAGQNAALKAFQDDQKFVTQTFVAVEPSGMDPCELRQHKGDTAVRDLIARRVPLFEFALRSTIGRFDLDTPEGRVSALQAAAPVVASIRDQSLRPEYARTLAGWLGMEVEPVARAVAQAGGTARRTPAPGAAAPANGERSARAAAPDPHDPALRVERDSLKVVLQAPALAAATFDELDDSVFTAPAYTAVRDAVRAAGGVAAAGTGGAAWVSRVGDEAADDAVRAMVRELAVEALPSEEQGLTRYATEVLARLEELAATRRIAEVKSRLQRLNPVDQVAEYNRLFGELVALEAHRRSLRERAIGTL